jgi:hypothetical protein
MSVVLSDRSNGVLTLTLNRPVARNAFDPAMTTAQAILSRQLEVPFALERRCRLLQVQLSEGLCAHRCHQRVQRFAAVWHERHMAAFACEFPRET